MPVYEFSVDSQRATGKYRDPKACPTNSAVALDVYIPLIEVGNALGYSELEIAFIHLEPSIHHSRIRVPFEIDNEIKESLEEKVRTRLSQYGASDYPLQVIKIE